MDFLETTMGRVILGSVVLVVWGINAVNFSKLSGQDTLSSVSTEVLGEPVTLPAVINYEYRATSRDPFYRASNQPLGISPQVEYEEPTLQLPQITLDGIFGATIMVRVDGGASRFVNTGEYLAEGILLKRIFSDSVHIEIGDQLHTLMINQ